MDRSDLIAFWKSGAQAARLAEDGLCPLQPLQCLKNLPPEERALAEKARGYGADYVFFRGRGGRQRVAEALVFDETRRDCQPRSDQKFADLHRRLWSWGEVPLVYRRLLGRVDLFRCGHQPDFDSGKGQPDYKPFERLRIAADIAQRLDAEPWWDLRRLGNGTLWDDTKVARKFLSENAAHASLLAAVKQLDAKLADESRLRATLRRRLLIICLLVAYLEDRNVFRLEPGFFSKFKPATDSFFQVLPDAEALIRLLGHLERDRFNGNVFTLLDDEKEQLLQTPHLARFASLIEGKTEASGQATIWRLYSFQDLPVELISHIYQLFVQDPTTCVYTPPFLARLMLEEALPPKRMDSLECNDEVIFDPACGSGVFLVEAFKRLVLHWRGKNQWQQPPVDVLRKLLRRTRGTDIDPYAIELASFSLCLAMCEELEPKTILNTGKLFPKLRNETLHNCCFFEMKRTGALPRKIGVVVGNPPFESASDKGTIARAQKEYLAEHGDTSIPDKQAAYLFLHHSMEVMAPNGLLCLLQKENFLYSRRSVSFRRRIFEGWCVREILDFTPVRNLFIKDSKVVVVVAEARKPESEQPLLHAIFRRTVRTRAEHSFELDYYDMHWVPRSVALEKDFVWRCNLFGGGRTVDLVDRLKKARTLKDYVEELGYDYGEGFVGGKSGDLTPAEHLANKEYLPARGLKTSGIEEAAIQTLKKHRFKSSYKPSRYTPPMVLIRQTDEFCVAYWDKRYLTYDQNIIGIAANARPAAPLRAIYERLHKRSRFYAGWLSLTSAQAGFQRESALQKADVDNCPFPEDDSSLDLSANEKIVLEDARKYYRFYLRHGEKAEVAERVASSDLGAFAEVFTRQVNSVYKDLKPLPAKTWAGICCMPFVFGNKRVDWTGADELAGKLDALLRHKQGMSLTTTRIFRLFDGPYVFLLKPERLRFWLRSVALRDADETLADLRAMGF